MQHTFTTIKYAGRIWTGHCVHRFGMKSRWCAPQRDRFVRLIPTIQPQPTRQYNTHGDYSRDHYKHDSSKWRQMAVPLVSVGLVFGGYTYYKLRRQYTACAAKVSEDNAQTGSKEDEKIKNVDDLEAAINYSMDLCYKITEETGVPGLSVSVTVDGLPVWNKGFGYADLENSLVCEPHSVMRIASISKSIAMTIVAKLMEEGKLDIDKPIQTYIPTWPEKTFKGQKVTITTRQLVSHLSGVRHYDKKCGRKDDSSNSKESTKVSTKESAKDTKKTEDDEKEFYTKRGYNSVTEALDIFKDDELCSNPGTEFLYTTHGWTVVSAVAEGAAKDKFPAMCRKLFRDLGLENTYLDEHSPLIYNRARQYVKNKNGRIVNAPYVDNSSKWAGGGFLSTTDDLVKFGNIMLYSSQHRPKDYTSGGDSPPGYLKAETMDKLWMPVDQTKCSWDPDGKYGMGWAVVTPGGQQHWGCKEVKEYFSHTGGAVGGSSVLIVLPRKSSNGKDGGPLPQGVVVAMIANMNGVGLSKTAMKIAKSFEHL